MTVAWAFEQFEQNLERLTRVRNPVVSVTVTKEVYHALAVEAHRKCKHLSLESFINSKQCDVVGIDVKVAE